MNSSTDPRTQLLPLLVELAQELPPVALNALISALELGGIQNLRRFAGTPTMRERLRGFEELCRLQPDINGKAIAFALRAAAEASAIVGDERRAEIAWTGPATAAVPLRRVDQVIYSMLETASEEILLVTFAAYRAERVLSALRVATDRGVRVRLVIELAQASGGKISFDGLQGFRAAVPAAQIYYWPVIRRERNSAGAYGSMHAKCLVVDRSRAIVSSANLTDYALEANMELGLVVQRPVAARLAEHFDQLIVREALIAVT